MKLAQANFTEWSVKRNTERAVGKIRLLQKIIEKNQTMNYNVLDRFGGNMAVDLTIQRAIVFATLKHKDQKRKGSDVPYIVHPMEVMQTLTAMGCDKNTIIAGILHDTLEDTDTTPEEIEQSFGKEILEIVQSETEDKTKTWKERKQKTIESLKDEPLATRLVCLADKLSNIRSLLRDTEDGVENLWSKFKAPKGQTAWYYRSIYDALKDSLPPYAADTLEEFREAIDKVFV